MLELKLETRARYAHFIANTASLSNCGGQRRRMEKREEGRKTHVKRGLWKPEEDMILRSYIDTHGEGNWADISRRSGPNSNSPHTFQLLQNQSVEVLGRLGICFLVFQD